MYTLHKTENIGCTRQKIYAAQNGKHTLHKMENIRCTKREIESTGCTKWKIYARQNRKYTLHKTENIRCTKENYVTQKITYVTQKRIQIAENGKWNTLPSFHSFHIRPGENKVFIFILSILRCSLLMAGDLINLWARG